MKLTTVCFLLKGNEILLGMKKRGFGAGKLNGFGGKKFDNETIEDAAIRELREEIGVEIKPENLRSKGIIRFNFEINSDKDQHMHVFIADDWVGEPRESEEMKPQWFDVKDIPYGLMWISDAQWLPIVLSGKNVDAEFRYDPTGSEMRSFKIKEIE